MVTTGLSHFPEGTRPSQQCKTAPPGISGGNSDLVPAPARTGWASRRRCCAASAGPGCGDESPTARLMLHMLLSLAEWETEAVRDFLENGGSISAAARSFGVSRPTVRAVRNGTYAGLSATSVQTLAANEIAPSPMRREPESFHFLKIV